MPRVSFSDLPGNARLWVFACETQPTDSGEALLLSAADDFLERWQAHGAPLTCAREWRDQRFLAIAVDQSTAGASGCSIDGLFNTLRTLESRVGSRIVGGGNVFVRGAEGVVECLTRDEFTELAGRGEITRSSMVFDPTITNAQSWRENFERPAGESWHSALLPEPADKT